jgi:hypothetical protein
MKTPKVDARSPEQKQADESAAAGKWEGFETETLISEEGALQLLRHNHLSAAQNGVDSPAALGSVRLQPFRWRDKVYRILRCDFRDGRAMVEVTPPDPEFTQEVTKRVEANRFHTLTYFQGFGFICFPEDYAQYQE